MNTFKASQSNTVYHDIVALATGLAITSGTVTFYLIAADGDNAGKWFRASDSSWQAAEASAGAASYKGGVAWSLAIAAAAWISGVRYILYAKESGDLAVVYSEDYEDEARILNLTGITEGGVWTFAKALKIMNAFSVMNMQLKSGTTATYEILDPDDEATVIAELTTNDTDPPTIEIKI